MGIPTVAIVSKRFAEDAKKSAAIFGCSSFPFAIVPDVLTGIGPEEIKSQVEGVFDLITESLTSRSIGQDTDTSTSKARVQPAIMEKFEGADLLESFHNMNKIFLDRGWGDGFPLIPPMVKAVDQMLTGTSRKRQEVVAVLAPGNGLATVEKIAINAVMAGCSSEHLPILISTCEAIAAPEFPLRNLCMSTSAFGILLVVNGPIAKKIGMNSGQCAMVPGAPSRVNVAIGRAMRLILLNIGHAYPQVMDMSTIGSPRKNGMCIAENEEANPWEPFHVEKGYDSQASTVSVFGAGSDITVADLYSYTSEGVLNTFTGRFNADLLHFLGARKELRLVGHAHILMSPDHAKILAGDGWSKETVKTHLFENARIPAKRFKEQRKHNARLVDPEWMWAFDAADDLLLPVVESPDQFDIVVVGGEAGISLLILDICGPVIREIK
ncbi:hypothetical protein ACFLVL_00225 [Chloroflexota bacterium]